jgi:hypothetical protein
MNAVTPERTTNDSTIKLTMSHAIDSYSASNIKQRQALLMNSTETTSECKNADPQKAKKLKFDTKKE